MEVSGDLRKDKQIAVEVRGLVNFLGLSKIIVFFATILEASSFCCFPTCCFYFSKFPMLCLSADFGAFPSNSGNL